MKKIKCLIVDDEVPAIELLEKYASMIDQLEVVGTCSNAMQAFDILKDGNVELLFIDINMPVMSGVDLIKALQNPPAIVFTTAYRKYAVEGYEMDALDYLLKPIAFDRFLKAVDKYRSRTIIAKENNISSLDHIFFKVNRTNHKVIINDIIYIESLKDYTRIHMVDKNLVVRGNISSCLKQLPREVFIRVHRSYAVPIEKIDSYNQSEVFVKDIKLPLGLAYRDAFLLSMSK